PAANSIAASLIATAGGLLTARKVNVYPGVKQLGSVVPGFVLNFGVVSVAILVTRIDYSISLLIINFSLTLIIYMIFMVVAVRSNPNVFYTVPGGRIGRLAEFGIASVPLVEPAPPVDRGAIVVADLHFDMPPAWERMLAEAALRGVP